MPQASLCFRILGAPLVLAILLTLLGSRGLAQESAFSSRNLPPDPVWQATRGARAATSPALAAGMGNPAAASSMTSHGLSFSHLAWSGGLSREWVAGAFRLPNGWTVSGDAALLRSGALESLTEDGQENGTFQPSEWSAGLSLSLPVAGPWSAGLGVRTFRLEDETEPVTGLGASLGLHWDGQGRRLGAAVTDLGPETSGGVSPYPLPTRWRAGYEQDFLLGRWTLAGGVEGDLEGDSKLLLGFSFRPVGWFEFLGGLAAGTGDGSDPLGSWSAGGRFRQGPMEVSYAFLPGGDLEATHQLGLTFLLPERGRDFAAMVASPSRRDLDSASQAQGRPAFILWAGRYRSPEAAESEARWLRSRGCQAARAVNQEDGSVRVLAGQAPTRSQAEQMAGEMKAKGVLVTVESGRPEAS